MLFLQRFILLVFLLQAWAEERDCQTLGTCTASGNGGDNTNDNDQLTNDDTVDVENSDKLEVDETERTASNDSTLKDTIFFYDTQAGRMRLSDPPLSNSQCNLFMAESAIPFAGWGMFTGIPLEKGSTIEPLDLAIQVQDQYRYQQRLDVQPSRQKDLPTWLMRQYYWNARATYSDYDANSIDSIIPSFGMLANSHTGVSSSRREAMDPKQSTVNKPLRSRPLWRLVMNFLPIMAMHGSKNARTPMVPCLYPTIGSKLTES
jgi:hypothetical protein